MSDEAVALLEQARATHDDLHARLLLAAAVERVARDEGLRSIVAGGTAVDYYVGGAAGTSATYPRKWRGSADVDLVVVTLDGGYGDDARLKRALAERLGVRLKSLGRTHEGREVLHRALDVPDLDYGLEIVATELIGDPLHVWTVEVDGHEVHLRGPEDTLLQYAESGWDTHSTHEWTRALAIWNAMRDEMDVAYLRRKADERKMPGVLAEVEALRPLPEERRPLF